ncbi:MAG: hypothetical protein ACAF41_22875 [Leptolyngbya sp. BL-A-14]
MPYSSHQLLNTPSVPAISTATNGDLTTYGEASTNSASASSASNGAVIGCLSLAIALSVTLFALGYKRYRTRQRARLLKQQVAMLEAMWRISSTK